MSLKEEKPTVSNKVDLSAFGLSAEEVQTLSQKCTEAKEKAYCRYSHFKVGATLLVKDDAPAVSSTGRFISGANIENASYPVGTCAERVALGTAVFEGHRYGSFKALAVATNTEPGSPASPCGMCRQFIREFCEPNMPIIMHDRLGGQVVMTVEHLLPMSFGPDSLPAPGELDKLERT
ncbi:cytidine deaminase [Verruconis gallopava]|uniref:Cytidine deaminase n=1 Tax=Verruconis gallopava TaxID=253628 RepID=A0A0D2ALX9_9PEZI|nr:cytidine deaminase [Verruconis gallopava]KIW07778.1 cytidine deaminase [Verruconis gallopava]